jgi:septum site-determining protein MinC
MNNTLAIKGTTDGLLVTLPAGEWNDAVREFFVAIDEQPDFFRGARLIVQLADREVKAADLGSLRESLTQRDIALAGVRATAEATLAAAADLGLLPSSARSPQRSDAADHAATAQVEGEEALLLVRTLRSGHSIHYSGHVVVLGDVNPGAEVVAAGHVIVWGRLRGTVHAGAAGDESAQVCALDLAPTQLRIAGHIAVSPARRGKPRPEAACIRDGQLVAEPWAEERRRLTPSGEDA